MEAKKMQGELQKAAISVASKKQEHFQPQKQDPSGSSKEGIERSSSPLTIISNPSRQYTIQYNQGTSRPSIHQYD
jgi:hypothetical protein